MNTARLDSRVTFVHAFLTHRQGNLLLGLRGYCLVIFSQKKNLAQGCNPTPSSILGQQFPLWLLGRANKFARY